jgi:hypothetical protein
MTCRTAESRLSEHVAPLSDHKLHRTLIGRSILSIPISSVLCWCLAASKHRCTCRFNARDMQQSAQRMPPLTRAYCKSLILDLQREQLKHETQYAPSSTTTTAYLGFRPQVWQSNKQPRHTSELSCDSSSAVSIVRAVLQ